MNRIILRLLKALQWRISRLLDRISTNIETRQSKIDVTLLQSVNALFTDERRLTDCSAELQEPYYDYCNRYSEKIQVISLEQASFLLNACRTIQPKRIADLGSGFSSYVVRKYLMENKNCQVISVDDHEMWLSKTSVFLTERNMPVNNLVLASDFYSMSEQGSFDLIFYDLGIMQVRKEYFQPTLALLSKSSGAMMLIDDVHKDDYRSVVYNYLKSKGIEFLNLKKITLDEFGRYAYAVLRK